MERFYRHWNHRYGLEMVKMDHAKRYGGNPTKQQRETIASEIAGFISSCYEHEELEKLNNVYISDHKSNGPKYASHSNEEDIDFFDYQNSIDDYNSDDSASEKIGANVVKYEKGTLLQRLFEPFAGAKKDENGTLLYTLEDKELADHHLDNDEELRKEFEKVKEKGEVWELDEEDE